MNVLFRGSGLMSLTHSTRKCFCVCGYNLLNVLIGLCPVHLSTRAHTVYVSCPVWSQRCFPSHFLTAFRRTSNKCLDMVGSGHTQAHIRYRPQTFACLHRCGGVTDKRARRSVRTTSSSSSSASCSISSPTRRQGLTELFRTCASILFFWPFFFCVFMKISHQSPLRPLPFLGIYRERR